MLLEAGSCTQDSFSDFMSYSAVFILYFSDHLYCVHFNSDYITKWMAEFEGIS